MSETYHLYKHHPDRPPRQEWENIDLPKLKDGCCHNPGSFNRPTWLNDVMDDWGLPCVSVFDVFNISRHRCLEEGWAYEQDWSAMAAWAEFMLAWAEHEQDRMPVDEFGNDYNSVRHYVECVLATANYVLAQDDPDSYVICTC